jgi:hypothetical protein
VVAPEIALLTMGPGPYIWERYGHTALSVKFPGSAEADCYNYGTMDFRRPVALFVGILRAEPVFWVSHQPCGRFIESYVKNDRTVYRQRLPLDPTQALAMAQALAENVKPENRHYIYHHFYDNCATRPRDLINRALGGKLEKQIGIAAEQPTFRESGRAGASDSYPLMFALDVFLGRGADLRPDTYGQGYLPDGVRELVAQRAGVLPEVIYQSQGVTPLPPPPPAWKRWLVMVSVFVAPAILFGLLGVAVRFGVALSLLAPAIIGVLLWVLAIMSSLPELRWNELLLVFVPVDLVVAVSHFRWRNGYLKARLGMLFGIVVLSAFGVLKQPLVGPVAMVAIPLVVGLVGPRQRSLEFPG